MTDRCGSTLIGGDPGNGTHHAASCGGTLPPFEATFTSSQESGMRSIRSGILVGAAAGAILMFSMPAVTSAGGDAAAGKAKATACAACHTAVGNSDTPHLAGQRETYIIKQLKAFKAGDRKHPVMNAMAGVLSDADFENVAAFWASQPAGSDATTPEEAAAAKKTKMAFPKDFPKGFTLYDAKNRDGQHVVAQAYGNAVGH
jgi:cytochrome c553